MSASIGAQAQCSVTAVGAVFSMRRTSGEDASGAHNVGCVNRIEPVAGISHSRCALLRLGRVSPVVLAEVCVSVCRLTLANLTALSSLTGVRAGSVLRRHAEFVSATGLDLYAPASQFG